MEYIEKLTDCTVKETVKRIEKGHALVYDINLDVASVERPFKTLFLV